MCFEEVGLGYVKFFIGIIVIVIRLIIGVVM